MGLLSFIPDTYGCATDVYDRIKKWRDLGDDNDARLRLFYLECKRNLAVLDCIGTRRTSESTDESELRFIAPLLETNMLEMLFLADPEGTSLFKVLAKKATVETKGKDSFEDESGQVPGLHGSSGNKARTKTVIQWAMFIYVRVAALKKLAEMRDGLDSLKKIKYRQRLYNIKAAYLGIIEELTEQEAIKEMVG